MTVAAQDQAADASLSMLPQVAMEAGLIPTPLVEALSSMRVDQEYGRDTLLRAINEAGGWVHTEGFRSSLQRGQVDIDGALRQRQLVLRADGNFHHPLYRASLVQIQGLETGGSLPAPADARTHANLSAHAPVKQQRATPAPKPATTPR